MIDIQIQGLNARQHTLADILWAYEDGKDADRFIRCLPTAELRNEAQRTHHPVLCRHTFQTEGCSKQG